MNVVSVFYPLFVSISIIVTNYVYNGDYEIFYIIILFPFTVKVAKIIDSKSNLHDLKILT